MSHYDLTEAQLRKVATVSAVYALTGISREISVLCCKTKPGAFRTCKCMSLLLRLTY